MPDGTTQVDTSKLKEKAEQAVSRHNFPYAMEIYQQVVSLDPNDADSRKALRAVALRHQQETGATSTSVMLKNLFPYLKLVYLSSKDYDKTLQDCEKYLVQDPSNYKIIIRLGDAAFAAGYNNTAAWAFEDALRVKNNDVPALRKLQECYRKLGEVQKAMDMNRKILQLVPSDRYASQAIRDLSATSMSTKIEQAGAPGAERGKAAQAVKKDDVEYSLKSRRVQELRSMDEVKQVIQYTLEDIEKQPENLQNRLKLGELYVRTQDWTNAEEAFEGARKLAPMQYSITMHIQDVELKKLQTELGKAKVAYQKNPNDALARNTYSKLYDQYLEQRLAYFVDREKNLPTDIKVAFELGNVYFEIAERKKQLTGNYPDDIIDGAVARFQKTTKDPGVRQQSQLRLGICFFRKKQYDLAIRLFAEAIDALEFMNDVKKELLYNRAKAYEAKGQVDQSRKDFLTIYEVDIDYRDVAELLKKA
jgi:tetratricopeptide (TPR) repeat protein